MKKANIALVVALLAVSCGRQHSKPSLPRETESAAVEDIELIEDVPSGNATYPEGLPKQRSELPSPSRDASAPDEHIQFIADVQKGDIPYSEDQLRRWRITSEPAQIPEVADFRKQEHARLFVAANPHRYESYAMYGLHFFRRQKFDVAVAAYDEAVAIIQREEIRNTIEYTKFYDLSLIRLYGEQREYDKTLALETFEKLVQFDFEFLDREPELAQAISLAAGDYYDVGQQEEAKRLVERARQFKNVPADVTEKLEWLYKRIEVEQAYSRRRALDN